MFTLHGLPPDARSRTPRRYLRFQHPEDRARMLEAITAAVRGGRDFALETRIVRADGAQRDVVLVGECC